MAALTILATFAASAVTILATAGVAQAAAPYDKVIQQADGHMYALTADVAINNSAVRNQPYRTAENNQQWTLRSTPVDGYYNIKLLGTNLCLDANGATPVAGTNVGIWTCGTDQPNQLWKPVPRNAGSAKGVLKFMIKSDASLFLTRGGASTGNQYKVATISDDVDQEFVYKPLGSNIRWTNRVLRNTDNTAMLNGGYAAHSCDEPDNVSNTDLDTVHFNYGTPQSSDGTPGAFTTDYGSPLSSQGPSSYLRAANNGSVITVHGIGVAADRARRDDTDTTGTVSGWYEARTRATVPFVPYTAAMTWGILCQTGTNMSDYTVRYRGTVSAQDRDFEVGLDCNLGFSSPNDDNEPTKIKPTSWWINHSARYYIYLYGDTGGTYWTRSGNTNDRAFQNARLMAGNSTLSDETIDVQRTCFPGIRYN